MNPKFQIDACKQTLLASPFQLARLITIWLLFNEKSSFLEWYVARTHHMHNGKTYHEKKKSSDNKVGTKNQRTTIARENRKLRPDLMIDNIIKAMISAWRSAPN